MSITIYKWCYIRWGNFGRSEFFIKVISNIKWKDTNFIEINVSFHEHLTQTKKLPEQIRGTNTKKNFVRKNLSVFEKETKLDENKIFREGIERFDIHTFLDNSVKIWTQTLNDIIFDIFFILKMKL